MRETVPPQPRDLKKAQAFLETASTTVDRCLRKALCVSAHSSHLSLVPECGMVVVGAVGVAHTAGEAMGPPAFMAQMLQDKQIQDGPGAWGGQSGSSRSGLQPGEMLLSCWVSCGTQFLLPA